MLSTGLVIYYIRDYSVNTIKSTKEIIENYSSQGILVPNISPGDALDNFCKNLPVGTIICVETLDESSKKVHVCLPMLTTHISLPIKPGETVWFYKETKSSFDAATKKAYPMLEVNSYWLSRRVGGRNTEDLSFAFLQRDLQITNNSEDFDKKFDDLESQKTNDKKRLKKIKEQEKKIIKLPDYVMPKTYSEKYSFLSDKDISGLYKYSKKHFDVYPAAIPRWNSKPFELSLQGSNNSLINLTKSFVESKEKEHQASGAIDLVAGRHMLEKYKRYSDNDFYIISDKIIKNQTDPEKRKSGSISINTSSSYLKIKNLEEDEEVLKNQEYFFSEEFKKKSLELEGEKSFKNDASRIYITEFDSLDNGSFYENNNNALLKYVDLNSSESEVKFSEKDYLVDTKKVTGKNFTSAELKNNNSILPSILIKSNDIRIVARKKASNDEKTLEEGSIKIVKESSSFYSSSCVNLEKDGSVFIDGSVIHLGSFEKEADRLKVDVEDKESLKNMSGNGYGLLIGYDQSLSEPLVLGNTLEAMLKEMIHVNIKLIEEIKKLTDDLAKHTHVGIPITGISGPPQVPAPYTNFSSVEHDGIKKRYEDLQNNLKDILSKFAKTS